MCVFVYAQQVVHSLKILKVKLVNNGYTMLDIFNGNIFYNRHSTQILNLNWKNDIALHGFECLHIISIFALFYTQWKFILLYIYIYNLFLFTLIIEKLHSINAWTARSAQIRAYFVSSLLKWITYNNLMEI